MKLIILDRDGVINFDPDGYIKSADKWEAIPSSVNAISKLKKLGFQINLHHQHNNLFFPFQQLHLDFYILSRI